MHQLIEIKNALTNPIANIRNSNIFVQLETLVEQHSDDLPKGDWSISNDKKDWTKISTLCLEILVNNSKDIQVIIWLIEANIHLRKDVKESFEILEYIIDNHWDIQDKDFAYKAFTNFDKTLNIMLPQYFALYKNDNIYYTLASFIQNKSMTDFEKLTTQEYEYSLELANIIQSLKEKASAKMDNNMMAKSITITQNFIQKVRNIMQNQHIQNDSIKQNIETESNNINTHNITSREQAYQMIQEIMLYLKTHDPHSATPYLLQKAYEWEKKSFVDIMNDFNDPVIIQKIFQ
ncbi:type VI secretion system protein TssA [Candidatus Cytomitobacter primus]|uniref:ImpA N-terminal domain-containing protein n=1 Tax=Candidatus Cytomitobacter primus TaxID=2066024 RepID=A0A5C0UGV2_9PROT|nr:type VI secretion system ImpA family N-terminal domain-containing protein [Candidatus Cytomitobacter primus]QEK38773.1 hypothetical protein FZC34_02570 [Candidatus Cytomitobacter primus]